MDRFPLDLVSRILSFLDGESLLQCSSVCSDFCQLTDQRSYWENAAWRLYPHLKETYDIMPYNGDWKALFKDRNCRNRSAVFEWTVTDFINNSERRYSPSFRVENYNFKVIVDPVGNPNVYFLEPGVSVYLACALATPNDQNGGAAAEDDGENMGDWECCCAFSLTACNQQRKGRNVTWHSSMLNDRFHKNRKNWGVHSLLPLTKLKDPSSGFVVDDSLKLKVRLRLLYLTVKVIRTSSLAQHRGFGVVDTGNDADPSVLSYELFHCTTLSHFKEMLVKDLGLSSTDSLRLWVFTQPWPDTVLCPREILINESVNNNGAAAQMGNDASDDDLNSPTLFSLLQLHMDGLGVARVWAECADDQGFCSNPITPPTAVTKDEVAAAGSNNHHEDDNNMAMVIEELPAAASSTSGSSSSTPGHRGLSTLVDAAAATVMTHQHVPGIVRCGPGSNLTTVPLWPDSRDASSQQQVMQQQQQQMAAASSSSSSSAILTAAAAVVASAPPTPTNRAASSDLHVLVFLKWLDPLSGQIAYLTHTVLRVSTPLHHLFSLVGSVVHQQPHDLSAHVETTPANWQPGSNALHRTILCPNFVASDQVQGGAGGQTIRDAAIENGQILTFYLSRTSDMLEAVYRSYLNDLFREAFLMYYGDGRAIQNNSNSSQQYQVQEGAAGTSGGSSSSSIVNNSNSHVMMEKLRARRHRTLKLEEVVNLFERFGYQSFRVRNVYYQHKHQNARQTLEYVIQGRHLGFCCDRCGATDFTGPRYKCLCCYDYDLCGSCQEHPQAAAHRYKYEHRGWRRESHFNEHNKVHRMHMILPVPCKLNLLHL